MKTPLVSVIIPTFNRGYLITKAIESVLKQTYTNLELIVVDDSSTDNTPWIVKNYPLKYVKFSQNRGVSLARNRGILKAKGEFLTFLDSDDLFLPQKIARQIQFLEKNPFFKLVQTEEIWFKGEKRLNPKNYHKKAEGYFLDRAIKLCVVSMSTLLVKKEVFKEVGLFDETFPVCEDYEFFLRVALKFPIGLIKEPLVIKYGGREDQLSATKGLDFYRVKALLKIYKNYFPQLSPEEKILIWAEAKRKSQIFLKGAYKHKNLPKIFELSKLWDSALPKFLGFLEEKNQL